MMKEMKLLSAHLLFDADGPAHNAAGDATPVGALRAAAIIPARPTVFLRRRVNPTVSGNARGLTT